MTVYPLLPWPLALLRKRHRLTRSEAGLRLGMSGAQLKVVKMCTGNSRAQRCARSSAF
jgi:hypothetical protein